MEPKHSTLYYYHEWTIEEERQLAEIMLSGKSRRKKLDDLFSEASIQLNRTDSSVRNRWYEIRNRFLNEEKEGTH